jgi:single-strand DNA-binding protein
MAFLQAQAIGNLGKDPEMNYTPSGVAVTKFSIAINQKQGDKETTTWLNCTAWRQAAETLNTHLHKGDQIFVQGPLTIREYTTKDGRKGTSVEITVDKFSFLGGKKATSEPGAGDTVDPLGDLDNEHPF